MSNTAPRVALITGAARRIGAAIAQKLHQEGLCIAIHYHTSKQEAKALAAILNRKRAHSAITLCADLAHEASLSPLVHAAHAAWGRLDALINNAALFYPTPFLEATSQDWDTLMRANAKAPFFLIQAAHPFLKATRGMVINITDASTVVPGYTLYNLSKATESAITASLATELRCDGIAVNTVAPGPTLPPEGPQHAALKHAPIAPGSLEAVAEAVWQLLSTTPTPTGKAYIMETQRENI
jgi:pteridine reductase